MYTALYYPYMTIEDENILKSGLLLWDKIEFIAPDEGMLAWHSNPEAAEACELITTPHVPSEEDKQLANDAILELVTSELPSDFLFEETDTENRFSIYPQKFLPETWDALRQTKLAGPTEYGEFDEWAMSNALGLSMMSILAESCAGTEKRTITNLIDSYKLLNQSIAGLHNGSFGEVGNEVERLITISIKIIDPSKLGFRELLEFRKTEERSQSTDYRELRHNFLKKMDSFVTRLVTAGNHKGSQDEIEREFEQEMSDDLKNLKEALKHEATDTLLSKEVAVGILAGVGLTVPLLTIPSAIIGVGALVKKAKNYRAERKNILKKHAMSWLFESGSGKIKLY